jgi:hypothetical protein
MLSSIVRSSALSSRLSEIGACFDESRRATYARADQKRQEEGDCRFPHVGPEIFHRFTRRVAKN